MNIFALSTDPIQSAEMMCDKHVVKMIIETAQLLSTAHRILDGEEYVDRTANGRRIKRWLHPNSNMESTLYKASHINHPSAVWARKSNNNYNWLYCHFDALCREYTYRYGKIHLTEEKLLDILKNPPDNIAIGHLTELPQAMPDKYKGVYYVDAYRRYYVGDKIGFAKWTRRDTPDWWSDPTYQYL